MKPYDLAGKLLGIIIILLIAIGCQPTTVIVTATPLPPTATFTPVTPTIAPSATVASPTAIVAPTLPSGATPTREIWGQHRACAETNPFWDDAIDGCIVNRNYALDRGFVAGSTSGVDVPRYWADSGGTIPVSCAIGRCEFNLASNPIPQSITAYSQKVLAIEEGTCYLAKTTWSYRLSGTLGDFPTNILFASFNGVLDPITQGANKPQSGDANFVRGLHESVWSAKGGTDPEPVITFGIQRQWAVVRAGSWIALTGMYLFAAPQGYCNDTTIVLGG